MTVSVVTDDAALRALEPFWRALFARAHDSMPFQSPDWMLPWWSCFGSGQPIVAVTDDGLLACYLLGDKLLPIGAGLTDYQDVLLTADAPAATAAELLGAVLETARKQGARQFHLSDLPPWADLRAVPAPAGWRDELVETDCCPVLTLPDHATELRAVIGAARARDVRQARHRAQRAGGYEIAPLLPSCPRKRRGANVGSRIIECPLPLGEGVGGRGWGRTMVRLKLDRPDELLGCRMAPLPLTPSPRGRGDSHYWTGGCAEFEILEWLHSNRWWSVGQPGVLGDPLVQAFHRAAAARLTREDLVYIPILRIGGRIAAASYVLLGPERLYLYLSGFDPLFSHESPGTILLAHIIETALRTKRREVHFLRGEEPYKLAWGGVPRRNAIRAFFAA